MGYLGGVLGGVFGGVLPTFLWYVDRFLGGEHKRQNKYKEKNILVCSFVYVFSSVFVVILFGFLAWVKLLACFD